MAEDIDQVTIDTHNLLYKNQLIWFGAGWSQPEMLFTCSYFHKDLEVGFCYQCCVYVANFGL